MKQFYVKLLAFLFTFFLYSDTSLLHAQSKAQVAREHLQSRLNNMDLSKADLDGLEVSSETYSKQSGITNVYFQQHLDGIPIHNAIINVHLKTDDEVLTFASRAVADAAKKAAYRSAGLDARQALKKAAQTIGLKYPVELPVVDAKGGPTQETVFSKGQLSLENIPVRLVYLPAEDGTMKLTWEVAIYETSEEHYWVVWVDAASGDIAGKEDRVVHCNFGSAEDPCHLHEHPFREHTGGAEICFEDPEFTMVSGAIYNVFKEPIESPDHGNRSLVTDPADPAASPFGWHDTDGVAGAEYTITRGNNTHAYIDNNNNPGFSPDGGPSLHFDFPLDLTQDPQTYEAAAVTNLFYWNNYLHDFAYQYGFDEANGNFQVNNYGNGGVGGDQVNAEAQDGGGFNNANFLTPADGTPGRMQMYLWTSATPRKDGDLDNGIIAHEYAHGISNRLTGGPSNVSCLRNTEQMGEGWSDYYTLITTFVPGSEGDTPKGIGTFALNQPTSGVGIRPTPYSTDMTVNPSTYNTIKSGSISVPHGVGYVWCTMLWDMTWAMIDKHGEATGLNMAIQLVHEGMKLQPCSPGFVDGRDAILAADQALYGGDNQCLIWNAFARRGLGFSASQGSTGSRSDGTEAFDLPPSCMSVYPAFREVCSAGNGCADYFVAAGSSVSGPLTITVEGLPAGTTVNVTPNPVQPGDTSTVNICSSNATPGGTFSLIFKGTAGGGAEYKAYASLEVDEATGPVLVAPANGATDEYTRPLFSWQTDPDHGSYTLRIATDANFANEVAVRTGLSGPDYRLNTNLSHNSTYYWRIEANNKCGTIFSETRSFTINCITWLPDPVLTAPANNATGVYILPELDWDPVPIVNVYRVQVATDASFNNLVFDQSNLQTTSYKVPQPLNSGVTYYWRVFNYNYCGYNASSPFSFTTDCGQHQPEVSVLSAPANNASAVSVLPAFDWTASANADFYRLEVATDMAFGNIVYTADNLNTTQHGMDEVLNGNTVYYWRVNTVNLCGTTPSAVFSFTTENVNATCNPYDAPNLPVNFASSTPVIISQLNIPVCGNLLDIDVENLSIDHFSVGGLVIELESPQGTVVQLMNRPCSFENDIRINLDDEADNAYGSFPCPPIDNGAYQPFEALSAFNGENPAGLWTLRIRQLFNPTPGSINNWRLRLCYEENGTVTTVYLDSDMDGFGDPNHPLSVCDGNTPAGYASNDLDCDDSAAAVNPNAVEICDNIDNNCDGNIDDLPDGDGDGVGACDDCDDNDANTFPKSYAYTGAPVTIPSNSSSTITSTISIADIGQIRDVNVKNLDITHTWINDLRISVTSPQGTTARLVSSICSSQDNMLINFDDEAPNAYNTIPCPPTDNGFYQPLDALSAFDGENLSGDWTLTVEDVTNFSGGSLNNWALEICYTSGPCPGITCYIDADGDNYGDVNAQARSFCSTCPAGYVANNTDCDDTDNAVYPGAPEICDTKDNNCDNVIPPEETDNDGDGYVECSSGSCEGSLTSLFDGGNGQSGNMFDVTNKSPDIVRLEKFDVNLDVGTHTVEIYYTTNAATYVGNETTAGAWTLLGSATVTSTAENVPVTVTVGGLNLPPNSTKGLYVTTTGSEGINYTNGENTYEDDVLKIEAGAGKVYPFANTFFPRTWNGNIHYKCAEPDCDDNNAAINPGTVWYKDTDNDGYSDGTTQTQCAQPTGYKLDTDLTATSGDCDDNNATLNPTTAWYKDADGDGYSDGTMILQCEQPATTYKLAADLTATSGDCDDDDATLNPTTVWYKDADNDGYSDGATQTQCAHPTGYKLATNLTATSGDCDDDDAALNPATVWYKDADNDGYSDGATQTQCAQPTGYKLATNLTSTSGDCNDDDPALNPATVWYKDADNDGYSDGTTQTQCAQPIGYKLTTNLTATSGDCNDDDPALNPATVWYKDTDNDGYSDGATQTQCTQPVNYKLATDLIATSGDCDDDDAALNPTTVWYKDADNDGYSDGDTQTQCAQPTGYKLATNLTATSGDCDDDDATLNPATIWYKDIDNDGYSDGTTQTQCNQPAGYKPATNLTAISGDCDDDDPALNPATVWYKDADNDGYSDGTTQTQCAKPSTQYKLATNLTATSGDCDDDDATLNPATVWYKDADNDGYSDGTTQTQCAQPTGYKLAGNLISTSGDCDDSNPALVPTTTWYKDADNDGYSDGTTQMQCSQPTGYKLAVNLTATSGDCDDDNSLINPATVWYKDTDNDLYSDGTTQTQCAQPAGYKLAVNLTATSGDCDDDNPVLNPATVWYKDIDNDLYSDGATQVQCVQPAGYKLAGDLAATSGDCDDNEAGLNPTTLWYKDADNDGYSDGNTQTQCTQPNGYKLAGNLISTSGDCDDSNPALVPTTVWYKDADNDGYSDGTTQIQCAQPNGYKLSTDLTATSGDCDDDNSLINPATVWYKDTDNDLYSDGTTQTQCAQPAGYKLAGDLAATSGDCDDDDAALNPATVWYKDIDNDLYSDGTTLAQCTQSAGYKLASNLIATSGDCNDDDASLTPTTVWYSDTDNDGYSNGNTLTQCDQPTGYQLAGALIATSGDCDDGNNLVNPTTTWYKDTDNDGYSDGATQTGCAQPTGYQLSVNLTATIGDCDDDDALINPATVWYKDADNDGYSDGTTQTQCAQPNDYKLAGDLIATSGDCDDGDATLNPATVWYKDADNDGYSDGTTQAQCTPPNGYKLPAALIATNGDCNDGDAGLNPTTVWYKDADNDGYSDGITQTQCAQPNGYKLAADLIATSGDCNDADGTVNPGAAEVCDNIDNNCNGLFDTDDPALVDNTPPTAICQSHTVVLDAIGQASIIPADVYDAVNSSDNCGTVTLLNVVPNTFACSNIGANTVTLNVEDGQGNPASCTATVTVTDNEFPVAKCQPLTVYLNAAGQAVITPADIDGGTSDNCSFSLSLDVSTFDCGDVGTNDVRLTATDPANQSHFCTAVVTVIDDQDPVAGCQPVTLSLDQNGQAVLTAAQVNNGSTDACGIGTMTVFPNAFNCADIGTSTVILTVNDINGNPATCQTTVTVTDGLQPNLVCKALSIQLDGNGEAFITPQDVFDAVTSDDNCGTINLTSVSPNEFDCTHIGENTVTLSANDGHGNTSTCQATVTVESFYTNITIATTPETCAMGDGSITISVNSPAGQTGYSIDGGATWQFSGVFENLSSGTYSVILQAYGTQGCSTAPIPTVVPTSGNLEEWYKDIDQDGYSDGMMQQSCTQPTGFYLATALIATNGDCNDYDANEHPGQTWYDDQDGDGYSPGSWVVSCDRPPGCYMSTELTATNGDCDDDLASCYPGAPEICNGIDDDCDGQTDEGIPPMTYVGNKVFNNQSEVNAWPPCYTVIDGHLTIQNSGITDLEPLINIVKVTGNVVIKQTGLSDLHGLDSLGTIEGDLYIEKNTSLDSLGGLARLDTVGDDLKVYFNLDLTDCCAIHDLINGLNQKFVGDALIIFRNDTGCDNVTEVNTECGSSNLVLPGFGTEASFTAFEVWQKESGEEIVKNVTLFPNPAHNEVRLWLDGSFDTGLIQVFDAMGRTIKVISLGPNHGEERLWVGDWVPGIYLVKVQLDDVVIAKRLVVEQE